MENQLENHLEDVRKSKQFLFFFGICYFLALLWQCHGQVAYVKWRVKKSGYTICEGKTVRYKGGSHRTNPIVYYTFNYSNTEVEGGRIFVTNNENIGKGIYVAVSKKDSTDKFLVILPK